MVSQTIEVTDLPKEENNRDVQNKGTMEFPTRGLGQVTLQVHISQEKGENDGK